MQNRFKLTPEAMRFIKGHVDALPAFQRRDKNGKLMFYNKGALLVNHNVNLREVYQKDGPKGVDVYVKFFMDLDEKRNAKVLG